MIRDNRLSNRGRLTDNISEAMGLLVLVAGGAVFVQFRVCFSASSGPCDHCRNHVKVRSRATDRFCPRRVPRTHVVYVAYCRSCARIPSSSHSSTTVGGHGGPASLDACCAPLALFSTKRTHTHERPKRLSIHAHTKMQHHCFHRVDPVYGEILRRFINVK